MSPPPLLQIRNLAKSFPGVTALDGVSLDVEAGKVHAVMGENGAGKSTLMNILAGLLQPDAGEILLEGRPVRIRDPHDALRRGIAMIHQELLPFPELTVAANIGMGREPTRGFPGWIDHAALNREAAALLGRLGMALAPTRRMGGLSVAEMQTVEIAKALAHEARVIIMDEPTSAIADREVEALFGVVRELTARGAAVLYISHKLGEVHRIADTITVLRDGRHVATAPARELGERRLVGLMVGREIAAPAEAARREPGEPVLETRDLTKPGCFRGVRLSLRRGEVTGLAGLMGAGRTSLVNALSGLAPAVAGEVRMRGRPVRLTSPAAALAAGIALVGEDRKRHGFVPRMSIQENLTLAAARGWWVDRRAEAALADEQIRAFGIKAAGRGQAVGELSGGNQQKVVIAKALLARPEVLLLDEPTRGIDIGAKAEVHEIIARLARGGMAILLASSELPELLGWSDRLLVMREGELTAELDPRRASQEEIMKHAMPA